MLDKIKITAVDIQGKSHDLGSPLELFCTKSLDTPADILKCSFTSNTLVSEMCEIDFTYNDSTLFSGYVDTQSFTVSKNGSVLSFSARSKACVLLDNEAMPMVFTGASIFDIYNKYIRRHNLFSLYYNNVALRYRYSVTKGMSEWDAFSGFCKMANGVFPHIDEELKISLLPRYTGRTIEVSNTEKGSNYLSLKAINDRYSVISSVGIRDSEGYYITEVKNPEAEDFHIARRRYLIPPNSYTITPSDNAQQKIQNSMGKKQTFEIIFAEFQNIKIGDFLNIYEPLFPHRGRLLVSEIKYSMTQNGSFTTIKAIKLKYS